MTPDQAVRAAVILRASTLVPIHFGVHPPPNYVEQADAVAKLVDAARDEPLAVQPLSPGETVDVPPPSRCELSAKTHRVGLLCLLRYRLSSVRQILARRVGPARTRFPVRRRDESAPVTYVQAVDIADSA